MASTPTVDKVMSSPSSSGGSQSSPSGSRPHCQMESVPSSWSHSVSLPAETNDTRTAYYDVKPKLTMISSPRSRAPTLSSHNIPETVTRTDAAISFPSKTNPTISRQDDSRRVVNPSSSPIIQPQIQHNVYHTPAIENIPSLPVRGPGHVSLSNSTTRPRTSNQVFPSLSDLAAHYGIPQFLPPPPRTTPNRPSLHVESTEPSISELEQLRSNYLAMLSQRPTDHAQSEGSMAASATGPDMFPAALSNEEAVQTLLDVLLASPEFTAPMEEFLTSPYEESPLDEPLITPAMESAGVEFMTSPLLGFDNGPYDTPLFDDMSMSLFEHSDSVKHSEALCGPPSAALNVEGLYAMPSPITPSLDPSSLYSPDRPTDSSFPAASTSGGRKKSSATGTRKNITPDTLVPLDAPTQPRKYTTPSATSRKELPSVFAKKRARSQAFGEDEDELNEEPLPPNATEKEQIEWKRRQNTLAARKSRKRKLQHQMELEDKVEALTAECQMWKTRALTLQDMLTSQGVNNIPRFPNV